LDYYDDGGEGNKVDSETFWTELALLSGVFVVAVLAFALLIDSKYLTTFISSMTGPQCAED